MASPYCEKFNCFATLDLCAEKCGQPRSNRRPSCPEGERRPRQWGDLPKTERKTMRGNAQLRYAEESYRKHLARANWASEELKSAAQAQLAERPGRHSVNVPLEALTALISRLDILTAVLEGQQPCTANVAPPNTSDCVPIGGRTG